MIKLSWTWGKEKISQHTSGFQKKKIKLHQNKNQFTYWKRYKWKGNPQMKKIFTVHISEKQNDTINREKNSSLKFLLKEYKWASNGINEYEFKLLFIRKMKIQTRKKCQYKVIRIIKMKYIDNTKCGQICGALGSTQILSIAPSGNVFNYL